MSALARSAYEGAGGWADGRLGQAYDLIDAVMSERHEECDARVGLKQARDLVEDADIEIGRIA